MLYKVELSKKAEKNLDRIDKRFKIRILKTLIRLETHPFLGKTLEGEYEGKRSCRVWPYRIIYEVRRNQLLVLVINIWHRQGVYR